MEKINENPKNSIQELENLLGMKLHDTPTGRRGLTTGEFKIGKLPFVFELLERQGGGKQLLVRPTFEATSLIEECGFELQPKKD